MGLILENLKYTEEHEWIQKEGDFFRIGVTDHAQDSMGDIVFVELLQAGAHVKQGDVVATLESVKAVSEVYAPISGEIIEVNSSLSASPDRINSSPYEEGWIFKIRSSEHAPSLPGLLDAKAYHEHIGSGAQT